MENGILSNDEIDRTVERTQNVTKLTLEWIDTYLEQNKQPQPQDLNFNQVIHCHPTSS